MITNKTDKEYLQQTLESKKLELAEVIVKHRIFMAQIELEKEMLQKQINSLERQLTNSKE